MTFLLQIVPTLIRHWKLVLLVLSLGGMGITGFHLARSWDKNAALVQEASTLKHRLGTITLLQATDAKRAEADADQINKLKEDARETPANSNPGLDRAAVRRLRAIR